MCLLHFLFLRYRSSFDFSCAASCACFPFSFSHFIFIAELESALASLAQFACHYYLKKELCHIIIIMAYACVYYCSYTVSCSYSFMHSRHSIPMYFFAISHARFNFLKWRATTLTTISQFRTSLLSTSVRHSFFFVLGSFVLNFNILPTRHHRLPDRCRVLSWVTVKRSVLSFIGCDLTQIPSIPVSANIIERRWGTHYSNTYPRLCMYASAIY